MKEYKCEKAARCAVKDCYHKERHVYMPECKTPCHLAGGRAGSICLIEGARKTKVKKER